MAAAYTSEQAPLFGEVVASEFETRTVEPFVTSWYALFGFFVIWLGRHIMAVWHRVGSLIVF